MQAITRPLAAFTDTPPDLNDIAADDGVLFVRGGTGLAGRGVAARVAVDEASECLGGDRARLARSTGPRRSPSVRFRSARVGRHAGRSLR